MTWTPEREAEIRKRCEAATEGPWELLETTCYEITGRSPFVDRKESLAMLMWWGHAEAETDKADASTLANGEFMAHSRTDLPDALAEIERLRRRVREVEAETLRKAADWFKSWKDMPASYERAAEALYRMAEEAGQ